MEKYIQCKSCNGHYEVREGKYGLFAGCSNYPTCKSVIKIPELACEYIIKYGLNLYSWKKKCWKCNQDTAVYSYYLYYELEELDDYFSSFHGIGLGDIPCVDELICNKIPNVKKQYSRTTNSKYVANICDHCQVLQGRNYVVDDPHEILHDLSYNHSMQQYLVMNLKINDRNLLSDLKNCIDFS